MSKKKAAPAKELERIHVSEYLDLVYSGEGSSKTKVYTLVANKNISMPIIDNDGSISVYDIKKGTRGGKVNGPHNLNISPDSRYNHIWIEKDSYVMGDAVVSSGIICGNSIIRGNAKVNCNGFIKDIIVSKDISLTCKHNIRTPYDLCNLYTGNTINLTDEGDILYIDGLKTLNKFDSGITIFDPGDLPNREDVIIDQILCYLSRNDEPLPNGNWYNNLSREFYDKQFDDYRNKVINAIYRLAKAYFQIPD